MGCHKTKRASYLIEGGSIGIGIRIGIGAIEFYDMLATVEGSESNVDMTTSESLSIFVAMLWLGLTLRKSSLSNMTSSSSVTSWAVSCGTCFTSCCFRGFLLRGLIGIRCICFRRILIVWFCICWDETKNFINQSIRCFLYLIIILSKS